MRNIFTDIIRWVQTHRGIVCIVLVTTMFIFFRISHADMTGDEAYYSIRSIGLVDFMFSTRQETPLLWFDELPWWARLSFHDHPLLLFLVQHFFLSFSVSTFFAKLPFALMALGTLLLTAYWVERLYQKRIATLSVFFLAINADFLWAGRTAVLESGVLFFLSLAVVGVVVALEDSRRWWAMGVALGLLTEVKFTTLFFFPALLSFLLLRYRRHFSVRQIFGIVGIIVLFAFPVILYNVFMYRATGHFSLQFVRLLHTESPWVLAPSAFDWTNPMRLAFTMSIPFFLLSLVATGWVLARREMTLVTISLFWLTLQTMVGGLIAPLYSIFFAPVVALFVSRWRNPVQAIFVGLMATYALFFAANSLLFSRTIGPLGWLHGENKTRNYGFFQLDEYLDQIILDSSIGRIDTYRKVKDKDIWLSRFTLPPPTRETIENFPAIIVFDEHINWSARVWTFDRRSFYENIAVFPVSLLPKLEQDGLRPESLYFVKATERALRDTADHGPLADSLEEQMIDRGVVPVPITRDDGTVAFLVYHMTAALSD